MRFVCFVLSFLFLAACAKEINNFALISLIVDDHGAVTYYDDAGNAYRGGEETGKEIFLGHLRAVITENRELIESLSKNPKVHNGAFVYAVDPPARVADVAEYIAMLEKRGGKTRIIDAVNS